MTDDTAPSTAIALPLVEDTPRFDDVARALARGRMVKSVARDFGVSEHALRRRLADPMDPLALRFKQEREIARQEVIAKMEAEARNAVDYLQSLIDDPKASHKDRTRAAEVMLKGARIIVPDAPPTVNVQANNVVTLMQLAAQAGPPRKKDG